MTLILQIVLRALGLLFAVLLVVVGYLVAPVLFANLDSITAGNLVGQLLTVTNLTLLTGLFGLLIIRIVWIKDLVHNGLIIFGLVLLSAIEYWISPLMKAIKADYPLGLTKESATWPEFAMWHGIYQLLFLTLIITLILWSLFNLKYMILNKNEADKKSL